MARWSWVLGPLIILLAVGWFNYALTLGTIEASQSVFPNGASWILSGLSSPNGGNTCENGWGQYIFNNCIPFPTIQQSFSALSQLWSKSTGSVIFGLVGIGLIVFAIFGNAQIASSGLNLTDSNTRLLVAMGFGYLIWAGAINFAQILDSIPYGIGFLFTSILTLVYSIGIYDVGRSIT